MRLLLIFLIASSCYAASCSVTTGGPYAHPSSASWTCGHTPAAGDTVIIGGAVVMHIANGDLLPVVSGALGSSASGVGVALTLSSTATLNLDGGGSLTLAGFDTSSNRMLSIASGATLAMNPTASLATNLYGSAASDFSSDADNSGTIQCNWSAGDQPCYFTSPSASYSWATTETAQSISSSNPWRYYNGTLLYVSNLVHATFSPLSNSTGTGIGSLGNTSLSSCSTSPAGALTSEKSDWRLVANAGDYWVDYTNGIFVTLANIVSGTCTWDTLTATKGWGVVNEVGSKFLCPDCVFQYMGRLAQFNAPLGGAVEFKDAVTTSNLNINNTTFQWGEKPVLLSGGVSGTSGTPIIISGITFQELVDTGAGTGSGLMVYQSVAHYLTVSGTKALGTGNGAPFILQNASGTQYISDHVYLTGTTGVTPYLIQGSVGAPCSDCAVFGNGTLTAGPDSTIYGYARALDSYFLQAIWGVAGHPFAAYNNNVVAAMRFSAAGGHIRLHNNNAFFIPHHLFIPAQLTDYYIPDVWIYNNVDVLGQAAYHQDGAYQIGYVSAAWLDAWQVFHNTLVGGDGTTYGLNFGDGVDTGQRIIDTGAQVRDNLLYPSVSGVAFGFSGSTLTLTNAGATNVVTAGPTQLSSNWYFNVSSPFNNYQRDAFLTFSGGNYNTSGSRTVTGVTVWNPTYSTSTTLGVKYTRTSATNQTLQLSANNGSSYGTATHIVWGTGVPIVVSTATAGTALSGSVTVVAATTPFTTSIVDNTSACSSATYPVSAWVIFLTGTAAGQIGVVTTVNSTSSINIVFPTNAAVSPFPAASDTFILMCSQVSVPDAASGSVYIQPDPRNLPSSSQTDTGIVVSFPGSTTTNPQLLGGAPSPARWVGELNYNPTMYQPGNTGLLGAGSDKATPGAINQYVLGGIQ